MPTLPTRTCNLLSSLVPCILTRRREIRFPPKPGHCGQCSSWSGVTVGTVVVPALVVFASAGSSRAQGSISGPSYGAFNAEIHWDEKTKRCKARKVPQGARGTAMPGKKQARLYLILLRATSPQERLGWRGIAVIGGSSPQTLSASG